jgi:hypothetical protein
MGKVIFQHAVFQMTEMTEKKIKRFRTKKYRELTANNDKIRHVHDFIIVLRLDLDPSTLVTNVRFIHA